MDQEFTFTDLVQAAKEEKWDVMDAQIPNFCNSEKFINWALRDGLEDENANVRDLAMTLLEKSKYDLQEEDKIRLINIIAEDDNIYVQFRAAFTLYNRGDRSEEVMSKMNQAMDDPEVRDIAEKYLSES